MSADLRLLRADELEGLPLPDELEDLADEAEANDPPGTSMRSGLTADDKRPGILRDAKAFRAEASRQETEATRPLTGAEQAQLDVIDLAQRERFGGRPLSTIPADPPAPLLVDRLDPLGHTILYGTGGSGKGTLATWWIARLVRTGHRVVILDYENHPDEWARRYAGLAGATGAADILHLAPLTAGWGGDRGALWQQMIDVGQLLEAWHATIVVVDSIVAACGGADPIDPGTAALYAGALEYLGRPTLSLAHVTKAEALAYPFGSVFWHNLARFTWSLALDGPKLTLVNRKHNNYPSAGRFVVDVTWREDLPREVREQGYSAALAERIDEVLGADELTAEQIIARIADELEEDESAPKTDSVRKVLRRGLTSNPARYSVTGEGASANFRRVGR